jgi:hypothetical protein
MLCSNMLDRSSIPAPFADDSADNHFIWAQTILIRQVERLEELSIAALRVAQAIERQVTESSGLAAAVSAKAGSEAPEAPPPSLDTAALAFSRVARAMHTTALLQSRLIGDLEQGRGRHEARCEAETEAGIEAEREKQRTDPAWRHKIRVEEIVARVAKPQLGEDEKALDRLMTEVCERLEDDDIYGDVMTRPVGELVALICRDLGLDPDWPTLAQEAWAREEIESGAENSPFQTLHERPPLKTAVFGGGGPSAERSEERMVEGAGQAHPPFDSSS